MTKLKSDKSHLDANGNGHLHRTHRTRRRPRDMGWGKSIRYKEALRGRGRMV